MQIKLFNTLTGKKEIFVPYDKESIKIYVCGPTVYSTPHIGNARSVVVYDVLLRILHASYGNDKVTYVRNITDVEDKIIVASKERNIPIHKLTQDVTKDFHEAMHALGCKNPNIEPKATEHIQEMIDMIVNLINLGHAYIVDGSVFFSITSDPHYGELVNRTIDEMVAGARVDIDKSKKHPGDFVLWKIADSEDTEDSLFDSPWGKGRPGWHIECSAMSVKYLGTDFDLHGGGADLKFPHHTNEIAQSTCCYPGTNFAKMWIHNGFLTVDKEKMSKSLGNIVTVRELLEKGIKGDVIRLVFLRTHYRKPCDWNSNALTQAQAIYNNFVHALNDFHDLDVDAIAIQDMPVKVVEALYDDMNISNVLAHMQNIAGQILHLSGDDRITLQNELYKSGLIIGLFANGIHKQHLSDVELKQLEGLIREREIAKSTKDFQKSDSIRKQLHTKGIVLEDMKDGTTKWYVE